MRVVLLRSLQLFILHFSLFTLHSSLFTLFAATGVLEDLPNTAQVVTNEEDAVAMAAVGALGGAVSNKVDVEVAGVNARIVSATNALNSSLFALHSSLSNHVDSTYAKKSEIPPAPDLAPYALKSELPTDYVKESSLTGLATRTWIADQGYATRTSVADLEYRLDSGQKMVQSAREADNANEANFALELHRGGTRDGYPMTVEDIVSEAQAGCVKTNHVGGVTIDGNVVIGSGNTAHGESALVAGMYSEAWSAVAEGAFSYAAYYSHAEGDHTYANLYSHAEGYRSRGQAKYSHVAGIRAIANHFGSYVWQGLTSESISTEYHSHGNGTYNISPVGGTEGFWIGETNFTQHVRNIAAVGERRVAVFVIPLNAPGDGGWNCLELKATTNNFDAAVGGESRLVYYAHTSVPDGGEYGGTSLDGVGVFLVGTGEDDRSYVATGGDALDGARSAVLVVDVSKCRRTDGAWLSSECDNLAWVCLRGSNDGREMDGGRTAWRPCAPVRWCRALPNWAR